MVRRHQPRLFDDDEEVAPPKDTAKVNGAYYTPDSVTASLVSWVLRLSSDHLLDPSCGDGRFLAAHPNSFGVEHDPETFNRLRSRYPAESLHHGDFFRWASQAQARFDCAAGNPPFIRYQRFTGQTRDAALRYCAAHGANFSRLSSSWAPFLVATATMLKPGGRMGFVVPAEIGHAPYAVPVLEYLTGHFSIVHIVAVREKLFPELSEDCWLLFADGFGGNTRELRFSTIERFDTTARPPSYSSIPLEQWQMWGRRLRPFLLPGRVRDIYQAAVADASSRRLGDVARVGIGYVTGGNDFFHLRPSDAKRLGLPERVLHPAVRSSRYLSSGAIDAESVRAWLDADEPVLLLRLNPGEPLPAPVQRYLNTDQSKLVREGYKCRNRTPWYVVPDVQVPDGFLSYMSGTTPNLVANPAGCVGTNSVHCVRLRAGMSMALLRRLWGGPLATFSCELEGHPLGGGVLKLEPREAARVVLCETLQRREAETVREACELLRRWRHHGE